MRTRCPLSALARSTFTRLVAPLTTLSFTLVALLAVVGGVFRRHGGLLRPFLGIVSVVALVALGLALDSLAVRMNELIPALWLRAGLPAQAADDVRRQSLLERLAHHFARCARRSG